VRTAALEARTTERSTRSRRSARAEVPFNPINVAIYQHSFVMSLLQLPHQVRTAHLLGAAALAGVLGLALWIKGRARAGPSSAADTPNAGNGSDEIILFGEYTFMGSQHPSRLMHPQCLHSLLHRCCDLPSYPLMCTICCRFSTCARCRDLRLPVRGQGGSLAAICPLALHVQRGLPHIIAQGAGNWLPETLICAHAC
jgi:hypothetical protein